MLHGLGSIKLEKKNSSLAPTATIIQEILSIERIEVRNIFVWKRLHPEKEFYVCRSFCYMLLSYLKFIVAKRILFSIQELLVLSKDNFSILILGKGIKKKKQKKQNTRT